MKKITLPDNIFSRIFSEVLLPEDKFRCNYVSSSLALSELIEDKCDLALIPSLEILQHKDLQISGKAAISFDGFFSNQFLYFKPDEQKITELFLRGDVTKNDIILSKILFSEKFGSAISLVIDTKELKFGEKNYLIGGTENFKNGMFKKGISFCDQICDLLDAPYVNYIVVSKNQESIEYFNNLVANADKKLEDKITKIKPDLDQVTGDYLLKNLNSIYFEMTPVEHESLVEMVRLCFYQGIIDDLFDMNII